MWALVVITVLALVSATAIWQMSAGRRALERRQNALQALWLARSGAELAAERLMAKADYTGESIELIPDSGLRIAVEKVPAEKDSYRIRCESRYPASGPGSVGRALTWKAIRRNDPTGIKLEYTSDDDSPAP
jgi:type II secretory pathway pseudopilin PulG